MRWMENVEVTAREGVACVGVSRPSDEAVARSTLSRASCNNSRWPSVSVKKKAPCLGWDLPLPKTKQMEGSRSDGDDMEPGRAA